MPPWVITGLSFYTLARAAQVPGTRAGPSPGRHVASHPHSSCHFLGYISPAPPPPLGSHLQSCFWFLGLWLPLRVIQKTKAALTCAVEVWEWNVRHSGWQTFGGKRLSLVPLQSLQEMVELLVSLKNSVTPYFLLQWTDLFFIEKWKELGFGSDRSQSHPVWCLLAVWPLQPTGPLWASGVLSGTKMPPPWRSVRIRGSVLEALCKWYSRDYSVQMQHSLDDKHSGLD